jgi:uncharacterized repeat protein (TIGR01451 family)
VSFLRPDLLGLSQLQLGWDTGTASYENRLPDGWRDVSDYSLLQFRVGVNFADARNPIGASQDFSVVLIDGAGRSGAASVSEYSRALSYPPGELAAVPKVVLSTVPIPLAAFTDVDLTDVVSVRFELDQELQGALLLADIAFSNVSTGSGAGADLGLSMSDDPDPVRLGQELTYKLVVLNTGPDPATNVVVTDALPPEVAFQEASDGCVHAAGLVSCSTIALSPGYTEEYELTVIVERRPSDGTLENTAVVSADQQDPDPNNDTATAVTRTAGRAGARD